jgi:hypothetical protein
MTISARKCRLYAKKSYALGTDPTVTLKRRTLALVMALSWTALATGIDRDKALEASRLPSARNDSPR